MGAYIVWFPRAACSRSSRSSSSSCPCALPAFIVLGLWFVLQFFTQSSSGIATLAHIGGFVFGMLVAFVLAHDGRFPAPPSPRRGCDS